MKYQKTLLPLMFAGTGSEVGKSVIATAFCRIFRQDGYSPAPFKAQNMSLNSYVTPDGLEIGRAQAVQAEAAGVDCHTDMNPVLLKPCGGACQVVLNGRPVGNENVREYYDAGRREVLRREVCAAFDRLKSRFNPVVMEGAGSIAEINLRESDIVNISMAMHAGAAVILVADIDRGGVFASVYGSVMLLSPEERAYIKGVLINKFRGDMQFFGPGIKMLEELCQAPVVGVVPYYDNIYVGGEDSVALDGKPSRAREGINIAVVRLGHISNHTDFDMLERDPRVHIYYTAEAAEIEKADIIILPGSKNTLSDLACLRRRGIDLSIVRAYRSGASVVGICGGYQMMGREICDPLHVEGPLERLPGLGLLPVETRLGVEKMTRRTSFTFLPTGDLCQGYEIHAGLTTPVDGVEASPLNRLAESGEGEGFRLGDRCFGTYMHGLTDNRPFIDYLLSPYQGGTLGGTVGGDSFRDAEYDKLAAHVRRHVDLSLIYDIMKPV
jgi:adenosylcobyric acid synthase